MDQLAQEIRVLVVDDSPISRKLLEYTLTESPYKLVYAKDGREALESITKRVPDLVITDWELPDITGPELCRKIRSEFAVAYTYLLLLTSNSDKKSLATGLSAGANDYLTKPFDREELVARVGVGRRTIEMHREIEAKTRRLAIEARTDPLTGLPNRRAVEEWASKQVAAATRHGYPIWVVLADLDSHKPVTDVFGRAAGDAMLQAFAEILKKHTRVSDMCGHLGGDQFILVVSHVEKDNIHIVVDRLREKLAARAFEFEGAAAPLIASFGIAVSDEQETLELPALLRKADVALLKTKRPVKAPAPVSAAK
jgi:two-component system, cell cycle response regulator